MTNETTTVVEPPDQAAPSSSKSDGLVLHLPLDAITRGRVADVSASPLPGTVKGDPQIVGDGVFGKCLRLDGSDDCVEVPDHAKLRLASYSLSVWMKSDGVPSEKWKGIVGKPGRNFNIWLNSARYIHHRFHDQKSWNSGAPSTRSGTITWDRWNHVVITNDGKTARTYIDGEEKAAGGSAAPLIDDGKQLIIGRRLDGDESHYFKGDLAHVRLYDRALTADEIRKVSEEDTWWSADDSATPPAAAANVSFKGNEFIEFDLSDDAQAELTIELWVKRGARKDDVVLFHSGVDRQNPGVRAGGELEWLAGGEPDNPNAVRALLSLPRDVWVHLAFVKSAAAKQMRVYADGVERANVEGGTGGDAPTPFGTFRLGHSLPPQKNGWSRGSFGFEGRMAELRIWNVARTPKEILAGMRVATTELPSTAGLQAYGPFPYRERERHLVSHFEAEGVRVTAA